MSLVCSCLPLRGADDAEMLNAAYMIALDGCTRQGLSDAVQAIISGAAKVSSKAFCPRPPELGTIVREKDAAIRARIERESDAKKIKESGGHLVKLALRPTILERVEAERRRMRAEGRELLFRVAGHSDHFSRRREIPPGGVYVGCLGEVYGPATQDPASEEIDEGLPLHS